MGGDGIDAVGPVNGARVCVGLAGFASFLSPLGGPNFVTLEVPGAAACEPMFASVDGRPRFLTGEGCPPAGRPGGTALR